MLDGIQAGQVVLVLYAGLLIAGGIMGYARAGSRASLMAGTISGGAALLSSYFAGRGPGGQWAGAGLAAAMLIVFGVRLARGRQFMPSGLLALFSLIVLASLVFLAL